MYIKFVHKTFSYRTHFDTVLTEKIRKAKFGHKVFVMLKHLTTKLNIPESSSYMSSLRAIVKSYQYCGITAIWVKIVLLHLKDPGTALMETKPIEVYTNENRL